MKITWSRFYTDEDELKNITEIVKSGWMTTGPKVKEFEKRMAGYVGVKHAVAVNSGTAALDVALKILGVGPGDEVIIPALTYIATAHAVCYQGAVPVFADVDPKTYTIDPDDIEKNITPKTKCIIPVDYAGHAADYGRIRDIANAHHLPILEDGAPGLFGKYKGKNLCSLGDISITSFHVAKIVSTVEGGMIFTDNDAYNDQARIIRWQGEDPDRKYYHPLLGFNHRMTDLNAVIGLAQTTPKRVADLLESRRQAAEYYLTKLQGIPQIVLPHVASDCVHPWFLFPILIPERDNIDKYLLDQGIKANISWPMPIYAQKSYQKFKKKTCPVAERVTREVLCLPLFYKISRQEQDYVIEKLLEAIQHCVGTKEAAAV